MKTPCSNTFAVFIYALLYVGSSAIANHMKNNYASIKMLFSQLTKCVPNNTPSIFDCITNFLIIDFFKNFL